ncbi:PIN domain-containing protein [Bosea sp. BIWAKO-01]|uniref:PIN domain-containing protein n=1 Tax=Bosea sp. BIWAKO-01 TaxID=506668 RepID=UPI000853BA27|nr:PIN domain-containing protein [Bosea sp. BIWAKO-01]GAU86920.1 VapC toxin protein [Bosea sp. BIWAKO-01]
MYLLSTDFVAEVRAGSAPAVAWLRAVYPLGVYLSVITLGELARAIAAQRSHDPDQAAQLSEWLRKLRHDHHDRILPVCDRVAAAWGQIPSPAPDAVADALLAATAIVHDMLVVSRRPSQFETMGASVVNPWDVR